MKSILILVIFPFCVCAQGNLSLTNFPSLAVPASSRGWGMGNTGIAGSLENQSLSYNVARSAFTQNIHQASAHYMPWLPGISDDAKFIYADYLGSIGNTSAIGVAINFLDLGTLAMRDENGATLGMYKANEYNIGTSYALRLGEGASLGATFKFFGQSMPDAGVKNTFSLCGDLGYYQTIQLGDASHVLTCGATVNNLGANNNLPTTAGIGFAYTQNCETGDRFMLTLDALGLLRDDWNGLRFNAGAEYGFDEQFFLRCGASLENQSKGNRKFVSFGAGYKGFVSDQSWGLDIFYLVPFGAAGTVSPFQNSCGLTLSLNIGNIQ
jgi:hypothetical protein